MPEWQILGVYFITIIKGARQQHQPTETGGTRVDNYMHAAMVLNEPRPISTSSFVKSGK